MIGLINERFDNMAGTFQTMSRVKMSADRLTEHLAEVFPTVKEPEKMELVQRDRNWSEYFFDQGKGNRMAGVTEWIDHRKSRQNPNQRLISTWVGGAYQTKSRAYTVALDKLAVWN